MPRLMEKKDWMQTLADVGSADDVWFENVAGDACTVSLSLPESGRYRVIFVKLDGVPPVSSSSTSWDNKWLLLKQSAMNAPSPWTIHKECISSSWSPRTAWSTGL